MSYIRNNWDDLKRSLSDGHLPKNNKEAERDLRCVAIGRKNWMFVGSEQGGERTAIILTIVASAHRHYLDVWAYLRDVLERLAKGESSLEELLPDAWKQKNPQHVRNFRATECQERSEERRYQRAKQRIIRGSSCTSSIAPVLGQLRFDCFFQFSRLEANRSLLAAVGDLAVFVDQKQPVRMRGIGNADPIIDLVQQRRHLDSRILHKLFGHQPSLGCRDGILDKQRAAGPLAVDRVCLPAVDKEELYIVSKFFIELVQLTS